MPSPKECYSAVPGLSPNLAVLSSSVFVLGSPGWEICGAFFGVVVLFVLVFGVVCGIRKVGFRLVNGFPVLFYRRLFRILTRLVVIFCAFRGRRRRFLNGRLRRVPPVPDVRMVPLIEHYRLV